MKLYVNQTKACTPSSSYSIILLIKNQS